MATDVTVEDRLSSGLAFGRADASQGNYDNSTGLWMVGDLAAGETATITIVATVESAETVANVGEVTASDQPDPDSTPNNDDPNEDDQDRVIVDGQQADLAVTKTVDDANATVGDTVEFTVEVTNNGPDTATNVSVVETLDEGLTFQAASATQGEYNEATNVYDVGALESGQTATLTLVALIESTENTTNTVAVTGDQPDPNQPNNTDSVTPEPAIADLDLIKTVNESTPNVGDTVEYTLTLTNNGPDTASSVDVTDTLPDGLSFVSAEASHGSYDDNAGLWTVDEIGADETATLSIVASVQSAESISNVAEVASSDQFDPDSTPNNNDLGEDDQDIVTIDGQSADLAVTKTVDDTNATVGDDITFTVEVTNSGPDTATNVSVIETLDEGLIFQGAETTQGEYDETNNVYEAGTLDPGQTATLTLTATIGSTENTTNAVEVTADQPDPNLSDNTDSATPVPQTADLDLLKAVNESTPNVGENVEFTLTLTNTGPNATTNVSVTDALPDGLTFVSVQSSQGGYNVDTGSWSVGKLSGGDQATLTIVTTVDSDQNITNSAEVNASDTFDPDSTPNNNDPDEDDQDRLTIDGRQSNLSVNKTVDDADVTVDDNVTFTIEVTNNGPDTATNVSVIETLDQGLTFQNASTTQGEYDEATNVYDVGTLGNGQTATLTLTATIVSTENTTNTAEVTADQPDPFLPDNIDSVTPDPQVADLDLVKAVNESAPNVGENVAYTVTLTNNGPDTATNVVVEDTLSDGLTFVDADTSQGNYDADTGLWTISDLSSGDETTLTIIATVDSAENVSNVAQVTASDQFDPDSTPNNSDPDEDDQDRVDVNGQQSDLAVMKATDDTAVTVGDNVTFTVEVTNSGPDTATNVSVIETLDEGLIFQSAEATQGEYDEANNVYEAGTLDPGQTATLTLTATIGSVDNTTNTVEVTGDQPDPNLTDNTDSVTPNPQIADLSLTKAVNESAPLFGETVEYTVTVTNNGPNATTNVSVTDALPDGLTFVSADPSQGNYNETTGSWSVGELDADAESTLTIIASVRSAATVNNVAEVTTSDVFDPNSTPNNGVLSENDQDNATIDGQLADLAVTKTVNDTDTTVGDNVTFTVEVRNNGPDTATNITVTDALDDGLTFQNASTIQGEYDEATNVYDVGTLANGETARLTFTATVEGTENITNAVEVTADQPDPFLPNNNDSVAPSPSVADLDIVKTVNTSSPNVGENVEFTLTVTNNGPNATTNVAVEDVLPDGLTFVSADPSQGSYDESTGLWSVGTVAADDTAVLSIVTTVDSTQNVTNLAQVLSSDQFDPDSTPNNNDPDEDDQDRVNVSGQQADLAVTKTVDDTDATVGDNVTFTVEVTNNGPGTATNVELIETLDEGLAFQSAETTQGEYDEANNLYDIGTLSNGETATLTLTVTIESVENTTNTVEVTGNQPDPNLLDNTDSVVVSPEVADLSLTKAVDESAPTTGTNVEYTITVANNGPNSTANVVVTEPLPGGVTFVSADPSQGTYDPSTGNWSVGELAVGADATLSIVAAVESSDEVTNTAEVTASDTFDPNSTPGNNNPDENDQASTTLRPAAPQCNVQVNDVRAPESVNQGQSATFEADVTNTGLADNCEANATINVTGESTRAVDIVFLVDTSGSTQPYIARIVNQLDVFATSLENQNIDARFAVVSYGGNGYVRTNLGYTSSSQQAVTALNTLNSQGGVERNYAAIETALNLNTRPDANTFLVDVTDEDSDTPGDPGVPTSDPSQTEIANQIDNAGATLISVSPTPNELRYPERAGYNPDQDIRVLSDRVQDGFWINLFTPDQSDNPNNLNNFVDQFEDIVIERVQEGISRETSLTLDAGESGTLSFTIDTSGFQTGTAISYELIVEGEVFTGEVTLN